MIRCGWCGRPTPDDDRCRSCGHADPRLPWDQRRAPVPAVSAVDDHRRRLAEAERELGTDATIERIAEHLEVSPRTVRRWREMTAR